MDKEINRLFSRFDALTSSLFSALFSPFLWSFFSTKLPAGTPGHRRFLYRPHEIKWDVNVYAANFIVCGLGLVTVWLLNEIDRFSN